MLSDAVLNTPVLLIGFNRPDTIRRVFEAIRTVRPSQLFIALDGPRSDVPADERLCREAAAVSSAVDWRCDLHTLVRDRNLGCGRAVSGAITWFFGQVQEGIILEDDCLPDPSFFRFCAELLDHYRDTTRIMHISGNNFLFGRKRGFGSYYYSCFTYNWGWATWRHAWRHYDHLLADPSRRSDNWDHQWRLSVQRAGGLAVLPNVNLVTNIGCGRPDATHTTELDSRYSELPSASIRFPLRHPRRVRPMDAPGDYSPFEPAAPSRLVKWKHDARRRIGALKRLTKRRRRPPQTRDGRCEEDVVCEWVANGRPVPPPHALKQCVVRTYAKTYQLRTLVESGTYTGKMVDAMRSQFDRIISVELSSSLATAARARFNSPNITIIQGDSGVVMRKIVTQLEEPAAFWLDGHYSGGLTARGERDSPILQELDAILGRADVGHVIMIDDARLFGVDPAYPAIEMVERLVHRAWPRYTVRVQDDVIRIAPAALCEPVPPAPFDQ